MRKKDMAALPNFLPVDEAARKYGLDLSRLHSLIEAGKIRAGIIAGETIVSEDEVRDEAVEQKVLGKEDLPEYQKYAYLMGVGVGINQAAKKYGIAYTTLYQWYQRGLIKKIGQEGQKVLLDEQDVAYCVEMYRKNGSKGKRIFNSSGVLYIRRRGV